MMKNINNFWMEHSKNICTCTGAVAIILTFLTLRYMAYFL